MPACGRNSSRSARSPRPIRLKNSRASSATTRRNGQDSCGKKGSRPSDGGRHSPTPRLRTQPTEERARGWQMNVRARGNLVLMNRQQLISAGFAITALAAAVVPAVAWTLLGDAEPERPAVAVQASYETHPFLQADAMLGRVFAGRKPEREARAEPTIRR